MRERKDSREQDQRTQICDVKEREKLCQLSKFEDRHAKPISSTAVTMACCTSRAYLEVLLLFTPSFRLEVTLLVLLDFPI
jgi:hypothetical protein